MKAIVYTSQTGFTRQYAQLLSEKTGVPAYELKEAAGKLPRDSEVFYMGWLMAGSVKGLERAMDRIEGLWPEDLGEYAKRILTLPVMLTQGGQQSITVLVYEALPATVSAAPELAVSDWLAWFEGKGMQHPDSEFQLNTAQNRK